MYLKSLVLPKTVVIKPAQSLSGSKGLVDPFVPAISKCQLKILLTASSCIRLENCWSKSDSTSDVDRDKVKWIGCRESPYGRVKDCTVHSPFLQSANEVQIFFVNKFFCYFVLNTSFVDLKSVLCNNLLPLFTRVIQY